MELQELKELLNKRYVGKAYDRWSSARVESISSWAPASDVKEMIEKLLPQGCSISAEEDNQHTTLKIVVLGAMKPISRVIASISVSKVKGKYQPGYWGGGSYEWNVKGVDVKLYSPASLNPANISLEQAVEDCVKSISKESLYNRGFEGKAKELYDAIDKVCKEQNYSTSDMIRFIYDNKWSLGKE